MRPRHWSNVTNHKNDHWKTVKLTITSFQKLRLQTVLIFFKFANPYLFWICCDLCYVIFLLHSIWWRFPLVYSKYCEISSWNSSFDLFCYSGCSFRSFLSLLFSLRASSPIWASEASLARTSLFSQYGISLRLDEVQMNICKGSLQALLSSAPRSFAARSRVLSRLVSLAQIGELARGLPSLVLT